jgi:hypothetical protein
MKKTQKTEAAPSIFFDEKVIKKERALSINWLLKVGQIKSYGKNEKQRSGFLFANLQRDLDHPKEYKIRGIEKPVELIAVPSAVQIKFNWPLYGRTPEDVAAGDTALGERKTPDSSLYNDAKDFLSALSGFVREIKEKGLGELGSINSFTKRHLHVDSKGKPYSTYSWENAGEIGPNILRDLLEEGARSGASGSSLRPCDQPKCGLLFYDTNTQRKYCSDECAKKANQKIKQANPKYNEYRKLFNQKKYWLTKKKFLKRKSPKEILNELAVDWRKKNVSEERIKQLLFPDSNK